MKKIVFLVVICLAACTTVKPQTDPKSGCVSKDCFIVPKLNCYMPRKGCNDCVKHRTRPPYYCDFSPEKGNFNTTSPSTGCQEWSWLFCGNNCCDNAEFNCKQNCNTINQQKYPVNKFPRHRISAGGRQGNNDQCLQLICYPGDNFQTEPKNSRSEISMHPSIEPGKTTWFSWSLKIPENSGYEQDKESCPGFKRTHFIISQLHYFYAHKGQKFRKDFASQQSLPFILNVKGKTNKGYEIGVRYGAYNDKSKNKMSEKTEGNTFTFSPDTWYDIVLGVTWSVENSTGNMDISVYRADNGQVVYESLNNRYANMFPDDQKGYIPNNFHMGIYRGDNFCTPSNIFVDEFSVSNDRKGLKSKWNMQSHTK